jgi:hypothetical protein
VSPVGPPGPGVRSPGGPGPDPSDLHDWGPSGSAHPGATLWECSKCGMMYNSVAPPDPSYLSHRDGEALSCSGVVVREVMVR